MSDLGTVKQLTQKADEAARKAAEMVRPAQAEALETAQRLRDELAANTSQREQIRRLADLVEASTAKRKPSKEAASTVLLQYINAVNTHRQIPASKQADGIFWIENFRAFTHDWKQEHRQKIADALVLGCQGKITAGLVDFPKALTEALTVGTARDLASLADPEGLAKFDEEQAALAEEYGEAEFYVDALEQAEPCLYAVNVDAPGGIAVRNLRGGDVKMKGICFQGNAVTQLNADEYAKVRDESSFENHLQDGTLQITSVGVMVEQL